MNTIKVAVGHDVSLSLTTITIQIQTIQLFGMSKLQMWLNDEQIVKKKSLIVRNQEKHQKQEAWWLTYNVAITTVFIFVKMTTYSKANERHSAVKKLPRGTCAEWHHANSAVNFDIPRMSKFRAKMTTMSAACHIPLSS